MRANPQLLADLVTFTEKIINGKLQCKTFKTFLFFGGKIDNALGKIPELLIRALESPDSPLL